MPILTASVLKETGYITEGAPNDVRNGIDYTIGERNDQVEVKRTTIAWDLSSIPAGSTVNSAKVRLKISNDFSNNNRTLLVYRLKRNWVEGEVTWNEYSNGNSWQNAGAGGANDIDTSESGSLALLSNETVDEYIEITITAADVEEMIPGGSFANGNNGFLFKMDVENDDAYAYYSDATASAGDEPEMVVDYTPPPSAEGSRAFFM